MLWREKIGFVRPSAQGECRLRPGGPHGGWYSEGFGEAAETVEPTLDKKSKEFRMALISSESCGTAALAAP